MNDIREQIDDLRDKALGAGIQFVMRDRAADTMERMLAALDVIARFPFPEAEVRKTALAALDQNCSQEQINDDKVLSRADPDKNASLRPGNDSPWDSGND